MPPSSSSGGVTRDGLAPLRDVIARHGLAARKSLGQNFLLDLNLTARIARAAGAAEGGIFYEVGPGPGGLTRALLAEGAGRVVAVERDERCLPALAEIAAAYPGKLEVLCGDALRMDEAALFACENGGVRIAANLPYNVGTALLIKWLTGASTGKSAPGDDEDTMTGARLRPGVRPNQEWPPFWKSCTLMFQKEVAQRITAAPGSEHYGRLAVLAGWRATAKILFDVPRQAFVPPPKITSSVVRLEPRSEPLAPCALNDLERVTAAAFGQRRKMLRQSLKSLAPDAEARIAAAAIAPTQRPEELTIAQFAALARAFAI
jgi:16S rRNA (adenine1518-N6/adenine1519-N6)-dimethyltransferase